MFCVYNGAPYKNSKLSLICASLLKTILLGIDEWLRRRIRMCFWKKWKKIKTKQKNLVKLGVSKSKAWEFANTRKSYWRTAISPILATSITNIKLKKSGLVSLAEKYTRVY